MPNFHHTDDPPELSAQKADFLRHAIPMIYRVKSNGDIIFLEGGFRKLPDQYIPLLSSITNIREILHLFKIDSELSFACGENISAEKLKSGNALSDRKKIKIEINAEKRWHLWVVTRCVEHECIQGQIFDIHEQELLQESYDHLREISYGTTYLGKRIALGQENAHPRDLTIMFIDIVNSTPRIFQMSLQTFKQYIETFAEIVSATIPEYNGYVDKFMGDGAMVIFGLETEKDIEIKDHPINAVLAGRKILQKVTEYNPNRPELEQIHIRIGIDSGTVLSGVFKNKRRMIFTCIGPVVNTAARLEKAAETDSILISTNLHHRIQTNFPEQFKFLSCSLLDLKGLPEPLRACKVR